MTGNARSCDRFCAFQPTCLSKDAPDSIGGRTLPNVLIIDFMDNAVAEGVISEFDVHWDPGFWGKRDELPQLFRCARDIVGRNVTMENPEIPEAASQLKIGRADGSWARQYQRGINAETCGMPGVEDCPAIGANGVSVAEHVLTTDSYFRRTGCSGWHLGSTEIRRRNRDWGTDDGHHGFLLGQSGRGREGARQVD